MARLFSLHSTQNNYSYMGIPVVNFHLLPITNMQKTVDAISTLVDQPYRYSH
ncbi:MULTISPECIES: hypothetical protein [unclassified Leptolyngbya]|uniref:hypothetical protein n=1 Tax=unclassified Leptolyngbya TaxID=2650499 RepID=UPI0016831A96|nr:MULTISPECIES: hypothetical protein [unclassified Leptolyngbya]MBD1909868.1 hypothetical protein [Leptolyngbya sp. FACHB-8]MBD2156964.1 hypothetical protein [Leptolyngbya sp. FACHB-16]